MKENKTIEDDKIKKNQKQDMPKWKKFFFIYPSISRSSYVLRALAGGYVVYLAGNNLVSLKSIESGNIVMIGVLSAILVLCGAHLAFSGAYALLKQEYH